MTQEEIEAVLGHEISHVANGDMVTLTLIQGVLNTFVIFLSRVIGYFVDGALRRDDDRGGVGMGYYITSMGDAGAARLPGDDDRSGTPRWREFHADAGGAHLAGKRKMVAALQRLKSLHEPSTPGAS